jgi:hypothetical protein
MMIRIPETGQDKAIALHLIIDVGERKILIVNTRVLSSYFLL